MSNKEWFVIFTKSEYGVNRYLIEHYLMPDINDETEYFKWADSIKDYFKKRTAIKEEVVAIETTPYINAYPIKGEDL